MQKTQNSPIIIEAPRQIQASHWYDEKEDCFRLKANLLVKDVTKSSRDLIWIEQEKWHGWLNRNRKPFTPMELVDLLTSIFRHEMMEQLGLNPHES